MSKRKCRYCKQAADISELKSYQPISKITDKTDAGTIFYAHETCYEARQKENKSKDSLYDYLLLRYFTNFVPPLLLKELVKLRAHYSYVDILDCLVQLEAVIKSCKTADTTHLCRLINYFIKQNIDDFIKHRTETKSAIEDKNFTAVKRREETEQPIPDYDVL